MILKVVLSVALFVCLQWCFEEVGAQIEMVLESLRLRQASRGLDR